MSCHSSGSSLCICSLPHVQCPTRQFLAAHLQLVSCAATSAWPSACERHQPQQPCSEAFQHLAANRQLHDRPTCCGDLSFCHSHMSEHLPASSSRILCGEGIFPGELCAAGTSRRLPLPAGLRACNCSCRALPLWWVMWLRCRWEKCRHPGPPNALVPRASRFLISASSFVQLMCHLGADLLGV